MRYFLFFIFCLISVGSVKGQLKVGVTDFMNDEYPHFVDFCGFCNKCGEAFECEILDEICRELGQECTVVPLDSLEHRITVLEDNEADFVISVMSVNPERAERVHFVRPYYYYAGAVVFQPDDTPDEELLSWEDIKGKDICINDAYYAIDAIRLSYGPNLILGGANNASDIEQGKCEAVIADQTGVVEGLKVSKNTPAQFGAPYAIAVRIDREDTLGAQISEVLWNLMDDGNDSLILQFENEHLVLGGAHQPSQRLADLVSAVTENGGPIEPAAEDAIWDEPLK